jgi:tellurite resistance protein TerC
MDSLGSLFLGQPVWMWLTFLAAVVVLLVLDLGVLHRTAREIGVRESLLMSAGYIALGLAFGGFVWASLGAQSGVEYLTGFVVEKSLAIDNVFVIAMIFTYFAVPRELQHRVLFWGILGVIVLRAIMIGFGAALVSEFGWVLYIFAAFLLFTGVKMLFWKGQGKDLGDNPLLRLVRRRFRVTDQLHGERFFVRAPDPVSGKVVTWITPLFLALVMIEIADLIFAVDSVPAIFAITTDPYIVYTSNIFAILGLRSLYFLLANSQDRFSRLKYGLALILAFIGAKMVLAPLVHISSQVSLTVVGVVLAGSVLASLLAPVRSA